MDTDFTIFIFLLPFLTLCFVFVFGDDFPHCMLYFQCYLCVYVFTFSYYFSPSYSLHFRC